MGRITKTLQKGNKTEQLKKFLTIHRLETEKNPKQKRKIERILNELEGRK